jgi:hypothetical protein
LKDPEVASTFNEETMEHLNEMLTGITLRQFANRLVKKCLDSRPIEENYRFKIRG